ncbi:MAG: DegT/DnrJ/EryC1/StrS family aminotransferase [Glaciecola sp.]
MDKTRLIPLFKPVITNEMELAALDVLKSGYIASGKYVQKFEESLGELIRNNNVVSVDNMTSAITLALKLSGVKSGDEVILSPFACMSTNSAIAILDAIPIWADNEVNSIHVSIEDIKNLVTPKTKAILVYHLAGYPSDLSNVVDFCTSRGIALIQDCNNSLLAEVKGQVLGNEADFSVFSFYPNRQINATEGGALVCKDNEDATKAKNLRRFGINFSTFRNGFNEICPNSDIPMIGGSNALNNLCAAIANTQITGVVDRVERARQNALKINGLLSREKRVKIVKPQASTLPAYWAFLIFCPSRDRIIKTMKSKGIHVSSLHQRTDIYTGFKTESSRSLPNIEFVQNNLLALPCGWWLTEKDIDEIVKELSLALDLCSRNDSK